MVWRKPRTGFDPQYPCHCRVRSVRRRQACVTRGGGGNGGRHIRGVIGEGDCIGIRAHQRFDPRRIARPKSGPRAHRDRIGSQRRNIRQHFFLTARANRHDKHHRGDPDFAAIIIPSEISIVRWAWAATLRSWGTMRTVWPSRFNSSSSAIQRAGRLIRQNDVAAIHQRPRHANALLLPS